MWHPVKSLACEWTIVNKGKIPVPLRKRFTYNMASFFIFLKEVNILVFLQLCTCLLAVALCKELEVLETSPLIVPSTSTKIRGILTL